MASPLRRYRKTLLSSGLIEPAELLALERAWGRNQRPKTGQELAQALINAGKLTPFQAAEIFAGRTGLVLGNYVILDRIGAGGMGQVFKARHRLMDRVVALKTLPDQASAGEDSIARFRREVLSAAKLSHPNIVAAYDADVSGKVHFLVMEFIEGQNLAEVVRQQGPLPLPMAVGYILDAARGLAYAHERGIVHRDVKPSNLIVDCQQTVKVLDLGLARTASLGAELTLPGDVVGTLEYMAPEQAAGNQGIDGRADIYGLGCTLYRLVTGELPYRGGSPLELVAAHREQPVPALRAARGEVPRSLESVFKRMVAKDANQRFQTMAEVTAALEKLRLTGQRSVARPARDHTEKGPARSRSLAPEESSGDDLLMATASSTSSAPPVSPMAGLLALLAALAGITSLSWFQSRSGADGDHELTRGKAAAAYASAGEWSRGWAEALNVPVAMTNSLGMDFVLIPPADVANDHMESGESPSSEPVNQPFYFGVHELTASQFRQFVTAAGYRCAAVAQGDRHPIVNLAAADAEAFCYWLAQRENARYRLPTHAEWAHACRAGAGGEGWLGDDESDLARYAWYDRNSAGRTHQVGLLDANPFGLHDLLGNAAEWCRLGGANTVAGLSAPQLELSAHALCGGSWLSPAAALQSREDGRASSGTAGGMRLVLELPIEARWPRRHASLPGAPRKAGRY
jgi:eukaryotic-like serine/threonine-protein kinase